MERQIDFKSENNLVNSHVIVEFEPKWLHHFGYPLKKLNAAELEVDQIFNQENSTRQIEKELNRLANNLEFYNWANGPERYLRGHFVIGRKLASCSTGIRLAVPRSQVLDLERNLRLVEQRLDDNVVGKLFIIMEVWRPLFNEFSQIILNEQALRDIDDNIIVAPKNFGTDKKHGKDLTARKYRKERFSNMSKFSAGREGRPKDEPYHLYWRLMFNTLPRLLKLRGINNERKAILVFGVLADGCNSYQLIRELQKKVERSRQSKSLGDELYDRLRQPFDKFKKKKWVNLNRNRIADERANRKKTVRFHPLLDFYRKLDLMPNARICDMKLSRYTCKRIGVNRHSRKSLSSQDLFHFLTQEWHTRSYFKPLGLWPDILEELYQRKKHLFGKKI